MQTNLFPPVAFDRILPDQADEALVDWGHYLGPCNRPFGRQDFGLTVRGDLVSEADDFEDALDLAARSRAPPSVRGKAKHGAGSGITTPSQPGHNSAP